MALLLARRTGFVRPGPSCSVRPTVTACSTTKVNRAQKSTPQAGPVRTFRRCGAVPPRRPWLRTPRTGAVPAARWTARCPVAGGQADLQGLLCPGRRRLLVAPSSVDGRDLRQNCSRSTAYSLSPVSARASDARSRPRSRSPRARCRAASSLAAMISLRWNPAPRASLMASTYDSGQRCPLPPTSSYASEASSRAWSKRPASRCVRARAAIASARWCGEVPLRRARSTAAVRCCADARPGQGPTAGVASAVRGDRHLPRPPVVRLAARRPLDGLRYHQLPRDLVSGQPVPAVVLDVLQGRPGRALP